MEVEFLNIVFNEDKPNETYPFMQTNQKEYTLIAQAISLDIRGNYGDILSGIAQVRKFPQSEYEWVGNCFRIRINKEIVKVEDLLYEINEEEQISEIDKENITDEESEPICEIGLKEFEEVVNKWKDTYLEIMGFNRFNIKGLSHLYGVLLLVYDKVNETNPSLSNEQIRYSIWQASKRYGKNMYTLYNQCKQVLGFERMNQFYDWCRKVFVDRKYDLLKDIGEEFLEIVN